MIRLRQSSLAILTNGVFMSRIRELIYRLIDSDEVASAKTVKCRLNELASASQTENQTKSGDEPSEALLKEIRTAASVPTTIWFDNQEQLPSLVAAGQATICRKLRDFIRARWSLKSQQPSADTQRLLEQLDVDWHRFCESPRFLLQEMHLGEPVDKGTTHV